MDVNIRHTTPENCRSACVVVGVHEGRRLSSSAKVLDSKSDGALIKRVRRGDVSGSVGATTMIYDPSGLECERVLLVGLGPRGELTDARFRKAVDGAIEAIVQSGSKDAVSYLSEDVQVSDRDAYWCHRQEVEGVRDKLYKIEHLKLEPGASPGKIKRYTLAVSEKADVAGAKEALAHAQAIANGIDLAKGLGNLPGNICTPTFLADVAKQMADGQSKLKVKVLNEADMRRLGMGSLMSVSEGSRQPAKLITFEYNGGEKGTKPVVLVGKGVTFDSGGISIKPGAAMDEMKFDMCGAASVFGAIRALVDMQAPCNVVGIVPATENLPDGNATKPGDVVTSMSGKTIEILNTDAEGRLILCDALTYASRYEPDVVIDIATLTGACVIALGSHASGLFSNDETLAEDLLAAGNYTGDRAWRMPVWEEYQEQLRSNFADMANVGGREGGAITAACFLARFAEDYQWAHLDIAGAAWHSGTKKGSTGRPVKLLTQYVLNHV